MISRVLSTGAACLRRFRQDARRRPIPVAAPVPAEALPAAAPVAVASTPPPPPAQAVTRPSPWVPLPSSAAANSNGPACKALPPRRPATAAVEWGPFGLRVRELSGRIRRAAALLAVAALLGAFSAPALAQTEVPANWSLKPAGLTAGDEFRLLFLSSTKRSSTSTNIADYNTFIQNLAAAGHADIQAYSAGFKAVGCTSAVDARDNTGTTGTGVPIYWLNGAKAADNYADFYDGSWDDEANDKNEAGTNGPDTSQDTNFPVTGCSHNGTGATFRQTLGASDFTGRRLGLPNSVGQGPLSSNTALNSDHPHPMYGLSEVFQVAAAANAPPAFSADTADRSVAENTATGQDVGAVLTATDDDGDTLTYTLEGADAASFDLDTTTTAGSARIRTRAGVTYDHEARPTHTVIVRADDGNGGTGTITVTIAVTDVDEPPGVPAMPSVSATAGSGTSLDVTWTAPANTGPAIASYDLQYREGTSGDFTGGPRDVTGTSAAIGNLAPNTSHEVQVRATNAEGDGGWSPSGTGTTAPSLPEVSIYALTPSVREGEQANFTLFRTGGGPRGALTVAILVESESGVLSTSTPPTRAAIRAGHGIASLLLPTAEEGVDGTAGKAVKVTLVADTADPPTYTLRIPASATVTVTDSGAPADVPRVAGPPAVGTREAGADGLWNEGETVRVTFTFSEAVVVSSWIGRPSVEIGFDRPAATRTARYLRGSRTKELVFGYTLVAGDTLVAGGAHRGPGVITIAPDSLALNGSAIRSMATLADAWLGHRGTVQHTYSLRGGRQGPGARFEGVPASHDGATAFTVELHFNAEPEGLSFRTVAGGLLEVEGGTVTRAARSTPGSNQDWRVTVAPSGDGDVQIRLPARSCGEPNAVCIGGAPLAQAAEATVPGASSTAPPPEVPLTASFSGAPAEHDGTGPFELRFRLSEAPAGLSYRTVQSGLFDVSGGTIGRAWRLQRGNDTGWGLRIEPSGFGDVTLALRATTDCAGTPGVCAPDGRMLGGGLHARIAGPPTLAVADAEVDEASGVTLDFAVSLSRALTETVTVEYRTADGSASAGADYTNTTGTLTFAAGETSKTVSVPVLDDEHDEGSETMTLRLRNPSPARVKLADGEATGTINNTDAMPQAWLARFGRTVAGHVLDGVAERMAAPRAAGLSATLGGQALPGMGLSGDAAARPSGAQTREAEVRAKALSDWLNGESRDEDEEARRIGSRTVTDRELALGSAFSLTGETAEGGTAGFWGRAAVSGFDGREGELSLDGEVTTGLVGADYGRGRWLMGLIASHSRGEGSYRGSSAGTVSSTLTGVHPWARYALSERLSVWGAAGYGAGTLTLDPEGEGAGKQAMQADLSFAMAAAGARGELLEPPGDAGGPALALVSDAMFVRTESERTRGLAAASADVTRLRLALDGSWRFALAGDAALTPSLELGVRHDGGDAETGFGVDIGGGLAFADPKRGLTFDVSARTLVAHEASGFRERGITAALTFDPRPSTDRGLTMSLRQTLGAASTGGADALMGRETLTGLGANDNGGARRLELTAGYGIAMFGGRFTGTPEIGVGLSDTGRDYSLGWRLGLGSSGGTSFELGLEATRRESASDDAAEHTVGFRLGATW